MTIDLHSPNEQWSMLIHDLRNPLATVHGYPQLLRRQTENQHIQLRDIDQGLRTSSRRPHLSSAIRPTRGRC